MNDSVGVIFPPSGSGWTASPRPYWPLWRRQLHLSCGLSSGPDQNGDAHSRRARWVKASHKSWQWEWVGEAGHRKRVIGQCRRSGSWKWVNEAGQWSDHGRAGPTTYIVTDYSFRIIGTNMCVQYHRVMMSAFSYVSGCCKLFNWRLYILLLGMISIHQFNWRTRI